MTSLSPRITQRLSAALEAQWAGGQFKFPSGRSGAVLYPIRCAAKEFYFAGTINTSNRIGGCLSGGGGRAYPVGEHFGKDGTLGGMVTRFTKIDGQDGKALIRLRGTGFILERILFQGRPYVGDTTSEGTQMGTKAKIGIEFEGRQNPATGMHVVRDCGTSDFEYGMLAAGGYWDAGGATTPGGPPSGQVETFVKDENHADNLLVDGHLFWSCNSCYRSENPQACNSNFRSILVGGWGGRGALDMTVLDIVKGGNIWVDGLSLNYWRTTVLAVDDYSPHTQQFSVRNLKMDHYAKNPSNYLTLFKKAGEPAKPWCIWTVRMDGHIASSADDPDYDASKLLQLNGAPDSDLKFDIARMPRIKRAAPVRKQ